EGPGTEGEKDISADDTDAPYHRCLPDARNDTGDITLGRDDRRSASAGRVQSGCHRVHIFPGDTCNVRRECSETDPLRPEFYGDAAVPADPRNGRFLCRVYRCDQVPHALYQKA